MNGSVWVGDLKNVLFFLCSFNSYLTGYMLYLHDDYNESYLMLEIEYTCYDYYYYIPLLDTILLSANKKFQT